MLIWIWGYFVDVVELLTWRKCKRVPSQVISSFDDAFHLLQITFSKTALCKKKFHTKVCTLGIKCVIQVKRHFLVSIIATSQLVLFLKMWLYIHITRIFLTFSWPVNRKNRLCTCECFWTVNVDVSTIYVLTFNFGAILIT